MLKKLCILFIFIITISISSLVVFADDTDEVKKEPPPPPKVLFTVTRPDFDGEKTFNKYYRICGLTDYENITVTMYRQGKDGKYEELKDVDGDASWEINASGIFAQEIILNMGINNIKVLAYDTENDTYKEVKVTITLLDINGIKKIKTDKINQLDALIPSFKK